ncbi:hypothetical protein JKF63_00745 [Porcisia hertigi]|uniref:Transmembrane protein n=1 Tax=Porcisia hertigi TaxID=2761500 RepID=A0A836KXG2_9TRYP|nr:hypothetical protein JKF63_00745 [Porcisia hertigi]
MGRAHRHSNGHGVNGIISGTSAAVLAPADATDAQARKARGEDRTRSDGINESSDAARNAAKRVGLLERCWKPLDSLLIDIFYTIGARFLIPHNVAAVSNFAEEGLAHRQGFLFLLGHFISIITLIASAACSRRFSNLMNGASPVMGQILFCVSHLSQVTPEQLGWSLFCSGLLPPSAFDWTALEGSGNGGVLMSSRAGGQTARRQALIVSGGSGLCAKSASLGESQSLGSVGGGSAGGITGFRYTGGNLVRFLLGRKATDTNRHESLRSYLYCSFYSPSAFLVEQTVWFVVLALTLDVLSLQRLAVAAFLVNLLGWLPVYSVKPLAGLEAGLVLLFMYWIPSYEIDDAVISLTCFHHFVYRVLTAYCASLCITLLFAETLLLDDVRRGLVQGVITLPQRLLHVTGHHHVVARLVHGCMRLRCEYFYFVDFYFFLGIMCWFSLGLLETTLSIPVFGTAALLTAVPLLVGNGWMETPLQALKDTVIYLSFYALTAFLLAYVVPWSGLAFLSNAMQSAAVLFFMASRCEYKQPGGCAYLLLLVVMMLIYLYEKSNSTRRAMPSSVWGDYDPNSLTKSGSAVRSVSHNNQVAGEAQLSYFHIVCLTFYQLLCRGLSEEGVQLMHFNVVVLGTMLLFTTTIRAVVGEAVHVSSLAQLASTSAETTATSAVALAAATTPPVSAATKQAAGKVEHTVSIAQVSSGRNSSLRGVSHGSQGGSTASSAPGKNRSAPQPGGVKALPSSISNSVKRPLKGSSQAGAIVVDVFANSDGSDGAATPVETVFEAAATVVSNQEEKFIEEVKRSTTVVESPPRENDAQLTSSITPVATGWGAAENAVVLETVAVKTDNPAVHPPVEFRSNKSKRGGKQKGPSPSLATVSSTPNQTPVTTSLERVGNTRIMPPHASSDLDGNGTEESTPAIWGGASAIMHDGVQNFSPEESVINKAASSLSSTRSPCVVSGTALTSTCPEQAASVTHRSCTPSEMLDESRCERPEQEQPRETERPGTQEPVTTSPSTASVTASTLSPKTKAERKDQQQHQRTPTSSKDQKNARETGPLNAAYPAPVLPQSRSQTEELKKAVEPSVTTSESTRLTTATETAEATRAKNSIADARTPATLGAKATRLKTSVGSTSSALAAVGVEKSTTTTNVIEKADGSAKAVAGRHSTNSKAAEAAPAANEADPSALAYRRNNRSAAAAGAAGAPTAIDAALAEKQVHEKATSPTLPAKESDANMASIAAIPSAQAPTVPLKELSTASALQSTATAPAAFPVPLPRSAKAADDAGKVEAAQRPVSSNEQRPKEPLQRAWREVRRANAVSMSSGLMKCESDLLTASDLGNDSKSKSSAVITAEEEEEEDKEESVAYDLNRVLSFLKLKGDCSADVDYHDEDHHYGSSSVLSGDRFSHDTTSFHVHGKLVPSAASMRLPLTNAHVMNCGVSATADCEVPLKVFSTGLQLHDESGSQHGSFAAAHLSSSASLIDTTPRVSHPPTSTSEWTATGGGGIEDSNAASSASLNCISTNGSGTFAPPGASSPVFRVFATHPNGAGVATTTTGPLSPQPQSAFMAISSHGSAPPHPRIVEGSAEPPSVTRHMDYNASSNHLSYYQIPQATPAAAPPSPAVETRLLSSSYAPFGISTHNPSLSSMPSLSGFGQGDSGPGAERSSSVSRRRATPKSWVSSNEQAEKQQRQQTQPQATPVATTMQPLQSAAPAFQQPMMMMMQAPNGQMALYPMVYKPHVYMMNASGMIQHPHGVQMVPHPQQQQMLYAAAEPSRGFAGPITYQIPPEGSYVTTGLQMSQQMRVQYPHQQ